MSVEIQLGHSEVQKVKCMPEHVAASRGIVVGMSEGIVMSLILCVEAPLANQLFTLVADFPGRGRVVRAHLQPYVSSPHALGRQVHLQGGMSPPKLMLTFNPLSHR